MMLNHTADRHLLERRFLMEPRKEVLKKTPEHRKQERKSRFQIVKLEERIAPAGGYRGYHGPGWLCSPGQFKAGKC